MVSLVSQYPTVAWYGGNTDESVMKCSSPRLAHPHWRSSTSVAIKSDP